MAKQSIRKDSKLTVKKSSESKEKSGLQSTKKIVSPNALQRLLEIQPEILSIGPGKRSKDVFSSIAEAANSLLAGSFCVVIPYDHGSDRFLVEDAATSASVKAREYKWQVPRPTGASRTALKDGELIIEDYNDLKYIKRYSFLETAISSKGERLGAFQDVAPTRASLGIRLEAGDEYYGVLFVNYSQPHKFTNSKIEIAKVFASQAAIAIRNARLYGRYRALIDSAESFTALHSAQNPVDVLKRIIHVVHEVLRSDLTVVFPYDHKNDIFAMERLVVVGENVDGYEFVVPRADGGTRKILRENKIIHHNLDEAPIEWKNLFGSGPFVQHFGIGAVAGVSLRVGDELVGVLYSNYKNRHKFDQAELDLIYAFANQVALVLFNTSVFEREQKARMLAETLSESASDLLQAPTLVDALNKTLALVKNVVPYDGALLMLAEGTRLISKAAIGFEKQADVLKFTLDPAEDIIFKEHGDATKPTYISDAQKDPRWKPVPTVDWVRGWLGVRLFSKIGDIIGEIGLYSRQEGFYNQEHANDLLSFSNQVALAIESARYLEQLKTISKIQGQILEQSADLDRVLETILVEALKLVNASIGQVLLLDESKTYLIISASTSTIDKERLLDINDCITGLVVKDKEHRPVIVSNVTIEEPYKFLYKEPEDDPAKSELAVPLMRGGEIIGVLNVESKAIGAFSEYHVSLLTAVANVTTSAIYTAESVVRNLNLIERTQEIILQENFDLKKVFHNIASAARETANSTTGELWLLKGKEVLENAAIVPDTYKAIERLKVNDSINGQAIISRVPILVNDTDEKEYLYKPASGIKMSSELSVPLIIEGEPIGTINVESEKKNAFTRNNVILLEALAEQAAIAIRAARSQQEQTTIANIQQEFLRAAFDLDKVFDLILKGALNLIGAKLGQLLIISSETEMEIRATTYGPDKGQLVKIHDSITGLAVLGKESISIDDVRDEPRYKPMLGMDSLRSELAVPLLVEDTVIGVVNVESEEIGAFTHNNRLVLENLARQAALSMRLAQSFAETESLSKIQESILSGNLTVEEASNKILLQAQRLINAETGQVLLLENDSLRISASTNPGDIGTVVPVKDSVSGMAVIDSIPVNVQDITIEEPYKTLYKRFLGPDMHSELVVPLRIGNKIYGVLNAESPRIGAFKQHHLDILSTLAGQAAIAFRTVEELELRKRASEADKMLSAGQIVHKLAGRSGAIRGWIEIIKDEQSELLQNNETFATAINDIEFKAGEILKLVDELKQRASEQFKSLEIPPLIDLALDKLYKSEEFRKFGGKIKIEKKIPYQLPQIRANSTLAEVFLNLLTNPVKAMPNGGYIEILSKVESEWVLISIKDNGPGIPAEMHDMIFDSKFSGAGQSGHGLGLWWSRAYVRALGGDILLDSNRGQGACFIVKLPVTS